MDNKMIERIVQRQIKANERVLKEIGRVIGMIGDLNPSEAYTIAQQLKYGESLQKIVKILSKNSRISEYEIYKMLEKEAKTNLVLKEIYYKAKKVDFIPYKDNLPLQALVNEVATSTLQTYRNISRTTGLTFLGQGKKKITKPIQEAYWQIIDDAVMNVSTGKQTFDQVMKDQLETIGNAGIQSIEYESGYHRRIDSAIRMNLQEGLSRLANEQQELLGEQFGANMVEVSHHEAPAPDHADTVDGKQFARIDVIRQQIASGVEKEIKESDIVGNKVRFRGKWYEDYDYVNDNLERPVSTLNCYHYAFTGVLGVTKPRYSKEELEKDHKKNEDGFEFEGKHYTMYEGQQLMNRLELELRKAKETKLVAEESGNQELLWKAQNRERLLASKYHKLSKTSGIPTRGDKIKEMVVQQPQESLAVMKSEPVIVVKNKQPAYEDITEEFIKNIDVNKKATISDAKSVMKNGKEYHVNDKNKIIHEFNEVPTAEWIRDELHKDVEYLPNIGEDDNVKLGDYIIDKDEIWELKTIRGNSLRTLDSAIKNKKDQADIFLFDITYSNMTETTAITQSKKIITQRDWVKEILIKNRKKLVKVLISNKKRN